MVGYSKKALDIKTGWYLVNKYYECKMDITEAYKTTSPKLLTRTTLRGVVPSCCAVCGQLTGIRRNRIPPYRLPSNRVVKVDSGMKSPIKMSVPQNPDRTSGENEVGISETRFLGDRVLR